MPSMREIMMAMPTMADPQKLARVNATIQFNFSGEEPGDYVLRVQDGQVTVRERNDPNADATIAAPSEVWKAIATGEMNPMTAFMMGKFKAAGNMALLMQMQGWFNTPG
ncbi:MAG: SCP2 sterol-binding domain-containing protein [Ardenticatenaceae bacterium]|nr:SCP2 sterol-binding domain-containing protein [Ardenticatenaceae bacterium]